MTAFASPIYRKCLHGMYDSSVCSICKGLPDSDQHKAAKNNDLVKDPVWVGIGVPQRESTAHWNKAPVLPTSEEIWSKWSHSPIRYRLTNKIHDAYLADLDLEEVVRKEADSELDEIPQLFRAELSESEQDDDSEIVSENESVSPSLPDAYTPEIFRPRSIQLHREGDRDE